MHPEPCPCHPGILLAIVVMLFLSGCASVDQRPGTTPSESRSQARIPTGQPTDSARTQAQADLWDTIPNPDDDLWIRVRNGFRIPRQADHPAIDEWITFYRKHDKHLHASLERAQPFLWHVVNALSERDMPLDLALLPIVESGYDASAVSWSGAGGLWQFMPPTAKDMGLRRNWWHDGRYDVLASTQAALDYLSWLHDRYDGNWLLALAAYNAGPGCVDKAIEQSASRNQPTDFWHLNLPDETTAYVPKLLALRHLLAQPSDNDMSWPALADRQRTIRVSIPAQIQLDIAADMLSMPESRLRALNPDVLHSITSPESPDTSLLVPIAKAGAFRTKLARTDPSQLVKRRWYRVRRGDTLSGIAAANGTSVRALRRANNLRGNRIIVGQRLTMPRHGAPVTTPTRPYTVQPGDTLWAIAHRHGIKVAALRKVNHLNNAALQPGQTLKLPETASSVAHTIRDGESLWAIAQRYNVTVAQLRQWNHLGDGSLLQPGQTLAVSGPAALPDVYNVQAGDTLWAIARHFEIEVATLRRINDIGADGTIQPGQQLRLQPAG